LLKAGIDIFKALGVVLSYQQGASRWGTTPGFFSMDCLTGLISAPLKVLRKTGGRATPEDQSNPAAVARKNSSIRPRRLPGVNPTCPRLSVPNPPHGSDELFLRSPEERVGKVSELPDGARPVARQKRKVRSTQPDSTCRVSLCSGPGASLDLAGTLVKE